MRHSRAALVAALALLAACTDDATPATPTNGRDAGALPEVQLRVPAEWRAAFDAYGAATLQPRVVVADHDAAARGAPALRVDHDLTCAECYRLEAAPGAYVVHAGGALGAQYGVTHVFEALGFRYFHPRAAHAPSAIPARPADAAAFGPTFAPEQRVRGIQLHTLHPIEALDFWTPSPESLANARAIIDWVVRNRGNHVQVVALDDIQRFPDAATAWRPHMAAIVAYAHLRGVTIGVSVQLFGRSNLQLAFDLIEGDVADPRATMRDRLRVLLDGVAWDRVNLSFGEFSGVAPETFVARVDDVSAVLSELAPGVEMSATIHVGDQPSLRVTYRGQSMLYYFLVRFADARIVPWVHTVMYYTLFGPAGGAYHHADFHEHRDYLFERLRAGQRVAYHPETAYWVAFDNSVPTYLPVYARSRWDDLTRIRAAARDGGFADLSEHVVFSSGWEWGYWQSDAAVLRMGFRLPPRWAEPFEDFFAPWGDAGRRVAAAITRLGDVQSDALIDHALAPYLAGREAIIDAGETMGIVAQPTRPSFEDVARLAGAERERFAAEVVGRLEALARDTDAVLRDLDASGAPLSDPWIAEVRDGAAIDAQRARFAAAVFGAALRTGASGRADPAVQQGLAAAEAALAEARTIVARRHAALHWPDAERLLERGPNPTLYRHGYLYYANTLCFWERERRQLLSLVNGEAMSAPACVL